jgi:hypothetical protein
MWPEALVREALIAVVNNTHSNFFKRYFFAYIRWPLDGEYYITGFRLALLQAILGDQPCSLQRGLEI